MRDMMWGKLVGQLLEEGIRVVGELEKEFAKQAEQAKTEATQTAKSPEPKSAPEVKASGSESLQMYTVENLKFQGYEVKQDLLPNLIHIHENGNPIAYVIFADALKIFVQPAVTNVQTNVVEATALIERLKGELLVALQAKCSDEIIMKTALDLTDAYVGETVAKEDAEAFNKLVQVLNSLLAVPQGVH